MEDTEKAHHAVQVPKLRKGGTAPKGGKAKKARRADLEARVAGAAAGRAMLGGGESGSDEEEKGGGRGRGRGRGRWWLRRRGGRSSGTEQPQGAPGALHRAGAPQGRQKGGPHPAP